VTKKQARKSNAPLILATPHAHSDSESDEESSECKRGDEESDVDMEVAEPEPVKKKTTKKKTKAGSKRKKNIIRPKLQDEIRAVRKEVPNLDRVRWTIFLLMMMCANVTCKIRLFRAMWVVMKRKFTHVSLSRHQCNLLRAKDPKVRRARVCMTVAGLVLQGITGG